MSYAPYLTRREQPPHVSCVKIGIVRARGPLGLQCVAGASHAARAAARCHEPSSLSATGSGRGYDALRRRVASAARTTSPMLLLHRRCRWK